jgi:Tfp pilus assembly protein PilF
MGDVAAAREEFEADVVFNPWLASGWHNLGVCQAKLGSNADAMVSFRRAAEIDPDDVEARSRQLRVAKRGSH